MDNSSRKVFLQQFAFLVTAALGASSFIIKKYKPLLSFSTLGCPDWSFKQIIDFAALHQYSGLEIRGINRELDITKCKEFNTSQSRADSLKMIQDRNLQFVNLGSSATLHFADGAERQKNLDEGRRFIDLANELKCPYVRVFPNNFQKDREKQATIDLISKGLLELAEHAKGSSVSVLMESHGDFVKIEDLEKVMQQATHQQVGMIWDITNMWAITKEAPTLAYEKLKKYIRHTHIKDAKLVDGKINYTLLGKGDIPIFEAIDILVKNNYKGYYSFEWEKLWHPQIAEPDIALADYAIAMKAHFK
jgi:sugar phosphate isomerase/epimerase